MPTVAVYAGTFDPPTKGHMHIIKHGVCVFDQLIVAIGVNPAKKTTFQLEERVKFIKDSINNINPYYLSNSLVRVTTFQNKYLVNYAKEVDSLHIIRGIRNPADFEYERTMMHVNAELSNGSVIPPRELVDVSSSFVKSLVGPEGWHKSVANYLPSPIVGDFIAHYERELHGKV